MYKKLLPILLFLDLFMGVPHKKKKKKSIPHLDFYPKQIHAWKIHTARRQKTKTKKENRKHFLLTWMVSALVLSVEKNIVFNEE
jgi:hypothetical protein